MLQSLGFFIPHTITHPKIMVMVTHKSILGQYVGLNPPVQPPHHHRCPNHNPLQLCLLLSCSILYRDCRLVGILGIVMVCVLLVGTMSDTLPTPHPLRIIPSIRYVQLRCIYLGTGMLNWADGVGYWREVCSCQSHCPCPAPFSTPSQFNFLKRPIYRIV